MSEEDGAQTVPVDPAVDPRPEMFVLLLRHATFRRWRADDTTYDTREEAERMGRESVGDSYDRFVVARIPGAGLTE